MSLKGRSHPQWKGGRFRNKKGYILVKSPDHPHRHGDGYVFEHRLIMEKKIGRFLKPSEIVHHRDGVVDNNEPSNLELCEDHAHHKQFHYPKKPCKFCDKVAVARGMCANHYQRFWQSKKYRTTCFKCGKDILKRYASYGRKQMCLECFRKPKKCKECDARARMRGLCPLHYSRWARANRKIPCAKCGKLIEKNWHLRKTDKQICMACYRPLVLCKVCGKPQYALKLCRTHYRKKYGF